MLYADILKIFERRLTLTGEEPISEAIAQLAHVDVITDKNAHDFHTWIRNGTVFFRIVHSEGSAWLARKLSYYSLSTYLLATVAVYAHANTKDARKKRSTNNF